MSVTSNIQQSRFQDPEKSMMMKIILSRKGFDKGTGGIPSPILPDGTLLSFPIPTDEKTQFKLSDLHYKGQSYLDIMNQLYLNALPNDSYCHLDPDIREGVVEIEDWKPAFGQVDAAQTHLKNQKIAIGDLFLFFGWFRQTEYNIDGHLKYKKNAPDIQAIYGYLQISEILTEKSISDYPWHPHASPSYPHNNTLYIPSDKLTFNNKVTKKPGYGVLNYDISRVLTKEGFGRSKWEILDWFNDVTISYHSETSIKDNYFQSARRGQEFVISENQKVSDWAKMIIGVQ